MDKSTADSLKMKNPRIPTFYLLLKNDKPNKLGRPLAVGIGSINEISAHVDLHLRRFTPGITNYSKDTAQFLNIIQHITFNPIDMLVTIDVS